MFVVYCGRAHSLLGFKSQLCHLLLCDLEQITEPLRLGFLIYKTRRLRVPAFKGCLEQMS